MFQHANLFYLGKKIHCSYLQLGDRVSANAVTALQYQTIAEFLTGSVRYCIIEVLLAAQEIGCIYLGQVLKEQFN